jgi:hypothetical protein
MAGTIGTPISVSVNFVVEDGTGLDDANSYCSVDFADDYHTDHGNPTDWSTANLSNKEAALRQATEAINLGFDWKGTAINSTMALAWPRYNVEDENSYTMPADEVPVEVKNATAYLALKVVEGDTLLPDHEIEAGVKQKKEKVGPLEESTTYFSAETPNKEYQKVEAMLRHLIVSWGISVNVQRA